jgi:hypothetical protein
MGSASRVYRKHAVGLASVTAREDIEFQASRFEQLSQQKDKRCFARSSDGEVADADHGATESLGTSEASIIKCVTDANPESEYSA